jgi:hypothetical protein
MAYVEGIVDQVLCHGRVHIQTGQRIFYVVVHVSLQKVYVEPTISQYMKQRTDKIYFSLVRHVSNDFLIPRYRRGIEARCRAINVIAS